MLEALRDATTYEEWEGAALELDRLLGNNEWRDKPTTKLYNYKLIKDRTKQLRQALATDDIFTLCHTLRSTLVRNLGNITSPKLYNRAYAGTKLIVRILMGVILAPWKEDTGPSNPRY